MQNKIHLLSPDLINKIAAGEVVERPASIVKELLENSIDAESKKITLRVEKGGINYIEVSDDGIGMNEIDAKLALVQHSTSKIKTVSDLKHIFTLGFRGEALASISSIAQTIIHTKTASEDPVQVTQDNGKIEAARANARQEGTTVIVKNIFQKIPARKKFLKSEVSEYKNILTTFLKIAIPHYSIAFDFFHNAKLVYSLSASRDLEERIIQVHPQLKGNLLPLYFSDIGFNISGFIGHPRLNRRDSSLQYVFINSRSVTEPTITKAVKTGFGTNLMYNQYPVYFLTIQIDPERVDVNVHPRKSEVRFDNPQEIFRIVYKTVRTSLESSLQNELKQRFSEQREASNIKVKISSTGKDPLPDLFSNPNKIKGSTQRSIEFTRKILKTQPDPIDVEEYAKIDVTILQVFRTYLIAEINDELLIIDQHAAAERITFEKLLRQYKDQENMPSQSLLIPEDITVSKEEILKLVENKALLKKFGFEVEIKGGKVRITALPEGIYNQNYREAFMEILADIGDDNGDPDKEDSKTLHKLISTLACHSSIRAGQKLNEFQAKQLVSDLLKCNQPYSCPHGRPIIWTIKKNELEKNFKRKL